MPWRGLRPRRAALERAGKRADGLQNPSAKFDSHLVSLHEKGSAVSWNVAFDHSFPKPDRKTQSNQFSAEEMIFAFIHTSISGACWLGAAFIQLAARWEGPARPNRSQRKAATRVLSISTG